MRNEAVPTKHDGQVLPLPEPEGQGLLHGVRRNPAQKPRARNNGPVPVLLGQGSGKEDPRAEGENMNALGIVGIVGMLFASLSYAWDCPTHTYICQLENVTGDCCFADSSHTPGATKHHCANNSSSCAARAAAQEYASRPEIAAHLMADAMSPPHWYSFTDEDHTRCHASFETAVGKKVGTPGWSVNVTGCHTKDGRIVDLYADEATLGGSGTTAGFALPPLPLSGEELGMLIIMGVCISAYIVLR